MCVLTNRTMSDFIRIAIQDKIKQIKKVKPLRNKALLRDTFIKKQCIFDSVKVD